MSAKKRYYTCPECGKKTSTTDPRRHALGRCVGCRPDLDAAPAKGKSAAGKRAAPAPPSKPPRGERAAKAVEAAAPKAEAAPPAEKETRVPAVPKKLSLLSAAALILRETGGTLSAKDILQHVYRRNLWTPPAEGKTPDQTLGAAIRREIAVKGGASRFALRERGKFAAAPGA